MLKSFTRKYPFAVVFFLLVVFLQFSVFAENPAEQVSTAEQLSNEHVEIKMTVGGKERAAYVYAPQGLPANRPLMISFHGMNMWHKGMADAAQFAQVADTAQFVVAYPNGDGQLPWDVGGDSELPFVAAIIDKMHELYQIDKKRVYISGFSWGANFCYRIANRMGDKIAAMVPMMGYPYGGNPNVAECSHPLPVLQMLGRNGNLFGNDDIKGNVLDKWITLNGCEARPKRTNPYPADSTTSSVIKILWKNNETGIEVVWMDTPNSHTIPMDANQILSNVEAWNFCKRYNLDGLIDYCR
ncbi:MAG: hypothetical protein LBR34_12195 [Prevotella sp.]|jgi:poly(3-hydroxybutyrate) depolymerase|nr:hypothetical protein [Prevotella sp.]